MEQKPAQEFVDRQSQQPFLVLVGRISPAEGDLAVFKRNQPMIGNRDATSITTEIFQYMLGTAEGTLGVNDPVMLVSATQKRAEELGLSQGFQLSVKAQAALFEGGSQGFGKLAAKHAPQHTHGKKEMVFRVNPVLPVGR